MKRRSLITGAVLGIPGAVVASKLRLDGVQVEAKSPAPKYVVGVNDLAKYEVSNDVSQFSIRIDKKSKTIDVSPRNNVSPHLSVLAFHRHICDMSDRMPTAHDLIDITDEVITSRSTDTMLHVLNGWSTTAGTKQVLVGGIEENDVYYSTIKVIGEIDYRLTKNIRVVHNGVEYPYHEAGYVRVPLPGYTGCTSTTDNTLRFTYDEYKNTHSVLNEETMELDIVRGVWTSSDWTVQPTFGITIIPIFSMG